MLVRLQWAAADHHVESTWHSNHQRQPAPSLSTVSYTIIAPEIYSHLCLFLEPRAYSISFVRTVILFDLGEMEGWMLLYCVIFYWAQSAKCIIIDRLITPTLGKDFSQTPVVR